MSSNTTPGSEAASVEFNDAEGVFDSWLVRFGSAIEAGDSRAASACVMETGYWKDVLAFTWGFRTYSGRKQIEEALDTQIARVRARNFRVADGRTAPRIVSRSATKVVEAFFDFETEIGRGTGFVRLPIDVDEGALVKAWVLLTTLHEIRGFEEQVGSRRPTGVEFSTNFAGDNWHDLRQKAIRFEDRDPQVVVVGGGQAGLILAARLGQFGVDTLVVERTPRVGDVWRNRYHSLTLHNEVWTNSLPYMPFPSTWPTFLPKDKLAGWLEAYAEAMELNVWTGTEFVSGEYDHSSQTWTAELRTSDGGSRTVTCSHLVMAVGGVSGVPNTPHLPGQESFAGEIIHSSAFKSGIAYKDRRAVVIGTGNSGHDVAQDLFSNGAATVTMVQRSPTTVVSLVPSGTMVYALYSEGPPPEDVDLITLAIPYDVLRDTYQWLTKKTTELDRELLEDLSGAGFRLDNGVDETGFHMKYLREGGGYYINVGCSDLISSGEISVVQADRLTRMVANGFEVDDGSVLPADLVVLATGYKNLQEGVRRMLGDEVADRVGPVWGFDENYAMRNMWQQTAQPGFWIMGGSLVDCRLYSRFLALQIRASLNGQLPPLPTAR